MVSDRRRRRIRGSNGLYVPMRGHYGAFTMGSILRVLGAGAVLFVSVAVPASPAWSSHGWVMLDVEPKQVRAGETVTIIGGRLRSPVEVRLGGLDGPLLGTFTSLGPPAPPFGLSRLVAEVTIPVEVEPGEHLLAVFHRGDDGSVARIPGWVSVTVVGAGGPPLLGETAASSTELRPPALAREEPVGLGRLLLVGAGVAGGALLLAVPLALIAARRSPSTTVAAASGEQHTGEGD